MLRANLLKAITLTRQARQIKRDLLGHVTLARFLEEVVNLNNKRTGLYVKIGYTADPEDPEGKLMVFEGVHRGILAFFGPGRSSQETLEQFEARRAVEVQPAILGDDV